MAKVIGPYDQDLGEVTDPGRLDFYRGTPGYTVIEDPIAVQAPGSLPKPVRRAPTKKAAKKQPANKAAAKPASKAAVKAAAATTTASDTRSTPSTPASSSSTTREENKTS